VGWTSVRRKSCEDLIKSVKYINFKADIFILGDRKDYNSIKNLVRKKQNRNINIYLKKYIKNPDTYFSKSHILINTSYFEGSNNAIIQGINNNLLILASNVPGGNKELLKNNKFGYLYKKDDEKDLAFKLNKLNEHYNILHSKLKLKKKFLVYFTGNFSNQKTLKIINKL
jgi:glycosyltransferase involved in cell wall biosynthesis